MAIKGKKGVVEFIVEIQGDKAAQEYQKLENNLIRLQKEQAKFNKGTDEYKKLQKEIENTNKSLKDLNPTYEQLTKRKRALERQLKRLTPGTEEFIKKSKEVKEVTEQHAKLKGEIDKVAKAQRNAGTQAQKTGGIMSRLKGINPFKAMLGPVGILLGLLGTLFSAFTKSERGAKLLTQAQGALNAVMSMLTGLVDNALTSLQKLFSNPRQALENFGKALVKNIINRFKGMIEMAGALGRALGSLLRGDMKAASEAAKEAGQNFLQMTTGLDEEQQAAFGQKVKEVTESIKTQTKSFVKLATAKRNAGVVAGQLAVQLQQLTNEEERLNAIADDATLSFKERETAAEAARAASEARAAKEIELAKAQLGLLSQEISLKRANGEDVNDLLQAQADARAAVLAAEGNLQQTVFSNEAIRRQLMQDRLERDLDIYIDGYDFQKTILERQFNDEKTSLERKKEIQAEIIALGQESFDKQIKIIEQFAGQNVDTQDLLQAAEDGTLQNKIRSLELSEIVEGRLLEIVKERAIAVQDFSDLQKTIDDEQAQREQERLKEEEELSKKRIAIKEEEEAKKKALDDEYQGYREAALQTGKQLVADSFDFFIEYLGRDEEARKKNAAAIKAFEVAKVTTNLFTEVSNYWKNYSSLGPAGIALAVAQTALATARAGLAIRQINAQQFASGGLVGGANIRPLSNGDNVLATLQTGEVVLTQAQQAALGGPSTFAAIGVPGFASGGIVGVQPSPAVAQALGTNDALLQEIKAMRMDIMRQQTQLKAVVVYDEFETKKADIEGARNGASW